MIIVNKHATHKKARHICTEKFPAALRRNFFHLSVHLHEQFLWRYVDELVGKGLEIKVLAQFFFLSALTLIPLSLPLAILLAALMTFGNFGERYELLSMKAAGIPLLRIMQPVILFCVLLGLTSFFFQNVVGPKAQKELWTLIVSMKRNRPK